jgi:hypothetical protein
MLPEPQYWLSADMALLQIEMVALFGQIVALVLLAIILNQG